MGVDLAGRPDKERIIHVERLGQKWNERRERDKCQRPIWMQRDPSPDFFQHSGLFSGNPAGPKHFSLAKFFAATKLGANA